MAGDGSVVVLCGGKINFLNLPIGTNVSNAMIPVNGKPVIAWILDDLLQKDIRHVVIVTRQEDEKLQTFAKRAYGRRFDLDVAVLTDETTIVQSLALGAKHVGSRPGPVRVVLGDTLIRDTYESDGSFIYVAEVSESSRWCITEVDDAARITAYHDRKPNLSVPPIAAAGYYHFADAELLRRSIEEAVSAGARELSAVLSRYGEERPLTARHVEDWFDFGNIDNFLDAKRRLLRPRYFNALDVDPVLGTITKRSSHPEKIVEEIQWYLTVPDELKILSPRVLRYSLEPGNVSITQEYYGYPTLAELYVYGDLHADTWRFIVKRCAEIHRELKRYAGHVDAEDYGAMYVDKTEQRLANLRNSDPVWAERLGRDDLVVNGQKLQGLDRLQPALRQAAAKLFRQDDVAIIHGDLCFSNILFDVGSQVLRLVDPRGSFGRTGIYGDAKYDVAKLRHSICGRYDFLTADMFRVEQEADRIDVTVYSDPLHEEVAAFFDEWIRSLGYDVRDIELVEGLLFVSMIPLHADAPQRQLAMFARGLELLNRVLVP